MLSWAGDRVLSLCEWSSRGSAGLNVEVNGFGRGHSHGRMIGKCQSKGFGIGQFSWEGDDGVKYESGLWKRSSLWEDDDGGECESSCAEKDDRPTFPCATFYTRPVPSACPLFFSR